MTLKETIILEDYIYRDAEQQELSAVLAYPKTNEKSPVVVYIHGHMDKDNIPSYSSISSPPTTYIWHGLIRQGFAVFMPTMVGYGSTGGEPDACGPRTIRGIRAGIDEILLKSEIIDKKRIIIYGISRGGNVAAQLATKYPNLFAGAILQSGFYDAENNYKTTKIDGIRKTIDHENGSGEQAFKERSPINYMAQLTCPVLILHGAEDDRVDVSEAKNLDEKLNTLKKTHTTVILPGTDHYIVGKQRSELIQPFLKNFTNN